MASAPTSACFSAPMSAGITKDIMPSVYLAS